MGRKPPAHAIAPPPVGLWRGPPFGAWAARAAPFGAIAGAAGGCEYGPAALGPLNVLAAYAAMAVKIICPIAVPPIDTRAPFG